MKAVEANLLQFLKNSPQMRIPVYQRMYSWEEKECRQLWDDIARVGGNDDVDAHFIGSVVYIEEGLFQVANISPLLVIDGQQRLTTLSLLLEALARFVGDDEPVEGFSARKIRSYYLLNELEKPEFRHRLVLTRTDRATLFALLDNVELPADHSLRVKRNFDFFVDEIAKLDDVGALCRGLSKLMIVDVSLSREHDNPQLVFESMNSTGRELSQADLIRNYILMGLEADLQTSLYSAHWHPMEVSFGQEAYGKQFDGFMRHYLTVKTGEIPNVRAVYEAFKTYSRMPEVAGSGVETLVADIHRFAGYFCSMALNQEGDPKLAGAFADLRELRVDVAYPLLLELYHDYADGVLKHEDFLTTVRLIEAYVFRRAICQIPTNSLNKTFSTFARGINRDDYLNSVQASFMLLPTYRRFPGEDEFKRELSNRDLYNFRSRSYWLRRLENYKRKERVPVEEYTIEHILPQNENLSDRWRADLGPGWRRVQEVKLHTLGNLTLTGYNSEYSDRPFHEKRDMAGGFKESPLRLNAGLGSIDVWNEDAIDRRARRLADVAIEVWAQPTITDEELEPFRPNSPAQPPEYTLADHPNLSEESPMRAIFDILRERILMLDPGVTEDILKLYVAYKAETNFVDVVPQASRLRLTLNMPFHELHDPHGIAEDVSDLGRWGNGDVEIALESSGDVPYVMGLIRQSFERQMGNGDFGD